MNLTLLREPSTAVCTIGQLFVEGEFECWTLEPGRGSEQRPIPAGRYQVDITPSTRFGRPLPILLHVPGHDGIRIHPGNTAADTTGCILVGEGRADDRITAALAAMITLQAKIAAALAAHTDVFLTIRSRG